MNQHQASASAHAHFGPDSYSQEPLRFHASSGQSGTQPPIQSFSYHPQPGQFPENARALLGQPPLSYWHNEPAVDFQAGQLFETYGSEGFIDQHAFQRFIHDLKLGRGGRQPHHTLRDNGAPLYTHNRDLTLQQHEGSNSRLRDLGEQQNQHYPDQSTPMTSRWASLGISSPPEKNFSEIMDNSRQLQQVLEEQNLRSEHRLEQNDERITHQQTDTGAKDGQDHDLPASKRDIQYFKEQQETSRKLLEVKDHMLWEIEQQRKDLLKKLEEKDRELQQEKQRSKLLEEKVRKSAEQMEQLGAAAIAEVSEWANLTDKMAEKLGMIERSCGTYGLNSLDMSNSV